MEWDLVFFTNSLLLGVGLAMDAFSVSMANGLRQPEMSRKRMAGIAGIFAGFQAAMPLAGWVCVHTVLEAFQAFEGVIPWVALVLLGYIGGKMLWEGLRGGEVALVLLGYIGGKMLWEGLRGGEETGAAASALTLGAVMMQGVATSIDALSVGFTIAEYGLAMALVCAALIAAVTFVLCYAGIG